MKKQILILIFTFIGVVATNTAQAQIYDKFTVLKINKLIANNGLRATPNAPETWEFATWNDKMPKQIIELNFPIHSLKDDVSLAGLITLQRVNLYENPSINKLDLTNCAQLKWLNCRTSGFKSPNRAWGLTELDLTNCTQLQYLNCSWNYNLTELDIASCTNLQHLDCQGSEVLNRINVTNCTQLQYLNCTYCGLTELDLARLDNLAYFAGYNQTKLLALYKNGAGEYTCPISLNNPTFGHSAINYDDGILKSTDHNVDITTFSVQTGKVDCILRGYMYFKYNNLGVNTSEFINSSIYFNSATGILFIECENFYTVKLYDMFGKEILNENGNNKTEMNISHLSKGVYIVSVSSEGKIIGNAKIVKQ